MGNSSIRFRGKWLSAGDYTLESWLYFLACEVDELSEKPGWLLNAQVYWNWNARIGLIGTVDANLDKYATNDEHIHLLLKLAEDTMIRLQTYSEKVGADNVRDLGDFGYPDDKLKDPKSYFWDANPLKLRQFGMLFCELLQGTLSPAKECIMRGYGLYRIASIIDYLATLIPDGEIGAAGIHVWLDQVNEMQIWIHPDVYWVSAQNPKAHFDHYEKALGACKGMPDLAIDVYPYAPWIKEKKSLDIHEQYGLPEHWYIDDEEHIVTVRQLVDGKLVVVETLHAGEQFVSKILGEKVVAVDRLLRTE